MAHQYAQDERETAVQKKYKEQRAKTDQTSSITAEEIHKQTIEFLQRKEEESRITEVNLNQKMINAYNDRVSKERFINQIEEIKNEYDQNGNRLACIWKNKSFIHTHDPIGIFRKKGNYEDLAWKVFRDLEDNQIFLKVLYYPKLTREDYVNLINTYNQKSSNYNRLRWISYGLVLGTAGFSWGFAYRNNFRFGSFLLLTGGSFIGLKLLADRYFLNSLNKSLNTSSRPYAEKYPEIKTLSIEYVKSQLI
jgi:hypothetical protein